MSIGKAKKVAMAIVLDPGIGKPVSDPIDRLNRLQAYLLDPIEGLSEPGRDQS